MLDNKMFPWKSNGVNVIFFSPMLNTGEEDMLSTSSKVSAEEMGPTIL